MTHTLASTGTIAAGADGSLAGGEAFCSCGWRRTHSLGARWAAKEILAHAAWMNRQGR